MVSTSLSPSPHGRSSSPSSRDPSLSPKIWTRVGLVYTVGLENYITELWHPITQQKFVLSTHTTRRSFSPTLPEGYKKGF